MPNHVASTTEEAGRSLKGVELDVDGIDRVLPVVLAKVARAENLIRLATTSMPRHGTGQDTVKVEFHLVDPRRRRRLPSGVTVSEGQTVEWELRNRSEFPVYASLFYINSRYGIRLLHHGVDAIEPGGSSGAYAMEFRAPPAGLEYFLVISTRQEPDSPPPSFHFLTQPPAELLRPVKVSTRSGRSSLDDLLALASSRTTTRSAAASNTTRFQLTVFPVIVSEMVSERVK